MNVEYMLTVSERRQPRLLVSLGLSAKYYAEVNRMRRYQIRPYCTSAK